MKQLCMLLLLIIPNAARGQQVADAFELPLDNYPQDDVCLGWADWNPNFPNRANPDDVLLHVADDACRPAGTVVRAVANGVVQFAGEYSPCPNWGALIIIEHQLPDGAVVSSIYGHVTPLDGVSAGTVVVRGERIGKITHMPCWADHIHFGMYLGPYSDIKCMYNARTGRGTCYAHGYLPKSRFPGRYTDPVAFVEQWQGGAPCHLGVQPGDLAYCSAECPCEDRQGDCDADRECQDGLVCALDVGPEYGFHGGVDVCVPPALVPEPEPPPVNCHRDPPGHRNYCSRECPCTVGESDCDNDDECLPGQRCVGDLGPMFGWADDYDVCVEPQAFMAETGLRDCHLNRNAGTINYCSRECPCPADFGDCDRDAHCQPGLVCRDNVGERYGWSRGTDVCERP